MSTCFVWVTPAGHWSSRSGMRRLAGRCGRFAEFTGQRAPKWSHLQKEAKGQMPGTTRNDTQKNMRLSTNSTKKAQTCPRSGQSQHRVNIYTRSNVFVEALRYIQGATPRPW